VAITSARPAAAAEAAAQRKEIKYAEIAQTHLFCPLAFEKMGPINVVGLELISYLGHQISRVTDNPREISFSFQRISVAIHVLTQSFFQILYATPMTTPQTFRSTPMKFNFVYNNFLNFFVHGK